MCARIGISSEVFALFRVPIATSRVRRSSKSARIGYWSAGSLPAGPPAASRRFLGLRAVLERLAACDHSSVSDVLARELRDPVSEHYECLSREIPGFAEALAWPEVPFVPPLPRRGSSGAPH